MTQLSFYPKLRIVDYFAGIGGFSEAARNAGHVVELAANHWDFAVATHSLNHPDAIHVCQDLRQYNHGDVPEHDLFLAGPSCPPFSNASQPKRRAYHDDMRMLPWTCVDFVEWNKPRAFVIENVVPFLRWDKLDLWQEALRRCGYSVTVNVLRASLCGVPQRRDRVFVCGHQGDPIRLDGVQGSEETPFGPCVDWDADVPWTRVADSTKNVRARVAKARKRGHGQRFLSQHTSDHSGTSLDEPIRTVTTKDQWVVVDGDRYRPLTVKENLRAQGFRDDYLWPEDAIRKDQITGIGNAVPPPMAAKVIEKVARALA